MLIDIDKIIIKDRIRKDYGNIEELAKDIKENGLINPPVVTPEYVLIAGERRTKACKVLDYSQIEVRVMTVKDALHQLKLEISENENRKDFSFSEKMQWAEQLKDEYSKIAKKNQLSKLKNQSSFGKILSNEKVDSSKQVAKDIGFGNKETYRQAKYIYENGNENLIKQLDEGQLSINKAYNTLKEEKKKLEDKNKQLQEQLERERNKEPKVITKTVEVDNTDYTQIEQLKKELQSTKSEKERIEYRLDLITEKAELYEKDSLEYEKMKNDIEFLTNKKDDLGRQIESITSISGLVVDIDHFVKEKLAPVKYSRALLEARNDDVVINNLSEIVTVVQSWCDEMKQYLPNKINYVEVL
ncbi:ParB N-terminal domain-containing protein [Clostridium botulinum D/C]|uniref:ParB N-terminal domain-containing protein n=1 Tax=Clostridium botulinum TaxID=1491 RepID=UPI001E2DB7C8|nr:ParB N-terminal domain-containing protein [Clostridium botulinum]MCD3319535.1 ParB N-terminal domain-containing protein [Clostridium botulinum D/C]MCD3324887.1 ParB N-terminal domain-containing protein [Clostridium botulinum D/C]MCD3327717.1 ParB N-terminal domain-containing protein [Clostridium botulinum D/C]